jgi:hypothetical protein
MNERARRSSSNTSGATTTEKIVPVYVEGGAREDARRRNGARTEIEEFVTMAQERSVNEGSLSSAGRTPINGG